jgi:hypothetical protein
MKIKMLVKNRSIDVNRSLIGYSTAQEQWHFIGRVRVER